MNRTVASLLLLAAALFASVAQARTSDRDKPLNTESDSSDCRMVDNAPCTLSGNVHITQGTLNIRSARADFTISDGEIRVAKLSGTPVRMSQEMDDGGRMNAAASRIDYDLRADTITLTGDASIQQPGRGSIAGERIVYNTRTGQVQGGGGEGSRVKLRFEPRNRTTAPAAKPADGQN